MNRLIFHASITTVTGAVLLSFIGINSAQAITLTTFSPIGFSDAIAGITGFQIEDFEDTTLIPGLSVEWASPNLGPVNILPDVVSIGDASYLVNDAWDGISFLTNSRQGFVSLSDITSLKFSNSLTSVGIGVSNLNFNANLLVNGSFFRSFSSFNPSPILGTGIKSIYLRIDAEAGETINSIGIAAGSGADFIVFDRLAIKSAAQPPQTVPEPSNIFGLSLLGLGLAAIKVKGILSKKAKSPTDNPQEPDS